MVLITLYKTESGVHRLLHAPSDLTAKTSTPQVHSHASAAAPYQELYKKWLQGLRLAYEDAASWWQQVISAIEQTGLSQEDAIQAAFRDRLAGPAAFPPLVALVRSHWLAVAALNDHQSEHARVRPEHLLLQWMIDDEETELVRLLACMPYWPIGMDAAGRWC